MQLKSLAASLLVAIACAACAPVSTADKEQAEATEKLSAAANAQVGMPGISNFQEKSLVKMLYELRDQEGLATFTYVVDLAGKLHLLCRSVGYGIPYAVQFSNPQKATRFYPGGEWALMPQPEPNGLFMPDSLSATWVMCADGQDVRPVYVEPQIVVSPFSLEK